MSSLKEGNQYSLSTENKSNKSVIFVKLTDSAVQSIEKLLNSKGRSSSKPSIQFQNNSGIISLPLNGKKHNYEFTLSNVDGDGLHSSFQCLEHIDNSLLESLGFMFMKMQIHATEDSYEKTKCKMTAADQEQKNLCTKELRQRVSRSGNKISLKLSEPVYVPEKTHPSFLKPEPPKLISNKKITSPGALIQQPIRERIIHILAAKSYKRAEILLRLKREGVSDTDKDQVNAVLIEVARMKGNTFVLEDHIWSEVQEDWEFYSKEELRFIKKKKQQLMKSKKANGITSPFKPFVKQKDPPSPPETAALTLSKKQKLSHIGSQNHNKIFQNDSCITNGNALTNGSAIGTAEVLPHVQDASGNLNSLNQSNEQFFSILSHKKVFPVDKNNHFGSNGSLQLSDTQSAINNNKYSLQTSSQLQDNRDEKMDVSSEEIMCAEETNNCNVTYQHKRSPSTRITSKAVSVCKQNENGNVPQIQVKQSSSCSATNIKCYSNSTSLSVLEKIKLCKQLLIDSSPPSDKNDNKINGSSSNILISTNSAPEFAFSEIQLKYTKVESLEQRSQYVQDFSEMYEEYVQLQALMKAISEKFSVLFDRLHAYTEGSPEFQKMKVVINDEYNKTLQNNSYFAYRKKFEFFKAKLSHIKEVILEYDQSNSEEEVL